jgi:hypothetical protein
METLVEIETKFWEKVFGSKEIHYNDDEPENMYPAELENLQSDNQNDR